MVPPQDARTSVLHNADILAGVFDELDWDEDLVGSRVTCFRAARVSYAFADAALANLWRRLYNLVPLWNLLLPEGVPRKKPSRLVGSSRDTLEFEKTIQIVTDAKLFRAAPRWARFLRYASYVQRLDHDYYYKGECDLLNSLIAENGGQTFLPALRRLKWLLPESPDSESRGALSSLCSPPLVELQLRDYTTPIPQPHRFDAEDLLLLSRSPAMRRLDLIKYWYSGRDNDAFIAVFTGIQHLRSLRIDSDCRTLDFALLRQLFASLPLEDLYFWIAELHRLSHGAGPVVAPHLRSLDSTGAVVDVITLLPELRAPHLTSFRFRDDCSQPTPQHLLSLCSILSQPPYSPTLTSLFLAMRSSFPFGLDSVKLLPDILHPVLSMPQLQKLSFIYPSRDTTSIYFTDDDLATLARALPNLTFLQLSYDPYHKGPSAPRPLSCAALAHLAEHCPRLEELHLEAILTRAEAVTIPAVPSHPLRLIALRCGDWQWGWEEEVLVRRVSGFLRLVDRLFPKLRATEPLHVLPKSLQPPDTMSHDEHTRMTWKRCKVAGSRNIFVPA